VNNNLERDMEAVNINEERNALHPEQDVVEQNLDNLAKSEAMVKEGLLRTENTPDLENEEEYEDDEFEDEGFADDGIDEDYYGDGDDEEDSE